jgi:tetratricopeptide (TPR) repeat protein
MTRDEAERLLAPSREAGSLGPDDRVNLTEAVRFFAANGDDESAAELAENVWRLWLVAGDVSGGRELLRIALDAGEGTLTHARALALYADGLLAFRAGAQAESEERNEAALEEARTIGDREVETLALVGLSRVALRDGDYPRVRSRAAEALELARVLGDDARVMPLHLLAAGTRLGGDRDRAIELYTESLELNQRLGDTRMVGVELHNIGHVELHRGNLETAEQFFAECQDIRSPDDPYDNAMTHLNKAALAFHHGDKEGASDELELTRTTLAEAGIVLDPDDAFEVHWLQERIR